MTLFQVDLSRRSRFCVSEALADSVRYNTYVFKFVTSRFFLLSFSNRILAKESAKTAESLVQVSLIKLFIQSGTLASKLKRNNIQLHVFTWPLMYPHSCTDVFATT